MIFQTPWDFFMFPKVGTILRDSNLELVKGFQGAIYTKFESVFCGCFVELVSVRVSKDKREYDKTRMLPNRRFQARD